MRIMVTAGPTREPLDAVRFLTNRSTGRMGYELAKCCCRRGHRTSLISGPVNLAVPEGVEFMAIETAREMYEAVHGAAPRCDALIMAAAVCDVRPAEIVCGKVKKEHIGDSIRLEKNPDILCSLKNSKGKRIHVGFAAETGNLAESAVGKLNNKGLDMIVGNLVGTSNSGFASETNKAILFFADGRAEVMPLMKKAELSEIIVDKVEKLFSEQSCRGG